MTDPVKLRIFTNMLSSVADEMGRVLCRTAFSPNIKERRDYSCAIFTSSGEMVAQASHIPVHLGSMPYSALSVIKNLELGPGDMGMLNDPYSGGTHLPDVTLVAPVYYKGECLFYVANRAHHTDVGGMSPGSMPLSREIYQEGLIIPPVKIVKEGRVDDEILRLILANVRTPDERRGDLAAQISANLRGIRRLQEIVDRYGRDQVLYYCSEVMDYTERILRAFIRDVPDGEYSFEDYLEDEEGKLIPIRVALRVVSDEMEFDFTGTASQVEGMLNAVSTITLSCVLYVVRTLLPEDVPTNQGLMRPVRVVLPETSVVNADPPAAIAGGNVETSQRIVDVLLGAFSKAMPDRVPAASQGTMNNLVIGGGDPPFVYYETVGGGMGACPDACGESAVHSHMTNTMNTPVEALEFAYPLRVIRYQVRSGSGGRGRFRGGDGIVREIELLSDAYVTVISQRRKTAPYGLSGGEPGRRGRNLIIVNGEQKEMGAIFSAKLSAGDRVIMETPGGGGYGRV